MENKCGCCILGKGIGRGVGICDT
ncbi:hypothetical protein HU200_040602 [Digitaria exilis]|uniref:Uncharacterized protein n=1 Tax=Digitaria exilis TaxID=1010633 RepID=A0A835B699_9POAL|nr:hypothetical protein HU200_040602 [Digitaria exilis]